MNFACKCLNVTIKSRSTNLEKINVEDVVGLTSAEKLDAFFQEGVATVPELEVITKVQPALLECKTIGSWQTHYCCNCLMYTHAVNTEGGITMVLINPKMIVSTEEIENMKTLSNYSSVFRIVIDRKKLNDMDSCFPPALIPMSQIPISLQNTLRQLQQELQEAIDRQTHIIDEKIHAFTMDQRKFLERFQEQAYMDHRLLSRIICKKEEKSKLTAKPRRRTKSLKMSESSSATDVTDVVHVRQPNEPSSSGSVVSESNIVTQQTEPSEPSMNANINSNFDKTDSVRTFRTEPSSYDAEVFFPLEGMDDNVYSDDYQLSSDLESDTDESLKNEGGHVSRSQKRGYPMLAKSLPVSVPDFRPFGRRTGYDDDDDKESVDPHNIRASIKALAKSVHGDTVFGDLPRPRFSTQI